jgi:ATP-dependent exoDNAse (exonuclease V) beta subunit
MTIHSSKGLEFDIVMIPFFDWNLVDSHPNDIIWCKPQTAPFNTIPLVPIHPSSKLLRSLFAEDYIHETLASYTDNLNITYVAITRARYRLYIYGPKYTIGSNKKVKISNVGQLASYIFNKNLDNDNSYISSTSTSASIPPRKESKEKSLASKYVSIPINTRLTLRSRSEDEFDTDAPLAIVDLGILMHLWLSYIRTWEDKDQALQRLIDCGQVTHNQATEMQKQMTRLQELISQYNHNDWFSDRYQILTEQDIISTSQNTYRPDRVMIKDKQAIIIDYKFGEKQSRSYVEQVRNYILQLREMGYTCEGYIIYNHAQTIQTIQ